MNFPRISKSAILNFTIRLTTGDSSLSPCIQSIVSAEIGDMEKAVDYARVAALMDLGDVAGNVKDGCHIAAMGGVWMIFVYGFAGLRDYTGQLCFSPRIPSVLERLRFQLIFKEQVIEVRVRAAKPHVTHCVKDRGSRSNMKKRKLS